LNHNLQQQKNSDLEDFVILKDVALICDQNAEQVSKYKHI
jgi:hypothetical protein